MMPHLQNGKRPIEYSTMAVTIMMAAQSGTYRIMEPCVFTGNSLTGAGFYFFFREEPRMHVHVKGPDGEAKFWIERSIELVQNFGLTERQVKAALKLIQEHEDEIRQA